MCHLTLGAPKRVALCYKIFDNQLKNMTINFYELGEIKNAAVKFFLIHFAFDVFSSVFLLAAGALR
jgi:hypothetical protein